MAWLKMLYLILMTNLLLSISFYLNHPISIALVLLLLSILFGMIIFKATVSWFFYVLVLVFLGGVMVVIMYMTSLAANEKLVKVSPYKYIPQLIISTFYLGFLIPKSAGAHLGSLKFVGSLYNTSTYFLLIFCVLSLVVCMVSVVKIVKMEAGPLVKTL